MRIQKNLMVYLNKNWWNYMRNWQWLFLISVGVVRLEKSRTSGNKNFNLHYKNNKKNKIFQNDFFWFFFYQYIYIIYNLHTSLIKLLTNFVKNDRFYDY